MVSCSIPGGLATVGPSWDGELRAGRSGLLRPSILARSRAQPRLLTWRWAVSEEPRPPQVSVRSPGAVGVPGPPRPGSARARGGLRCETAAHPAVSRPVPAPVSEGLAAAADTCGSGDSSLISGTLSSQGLLGAPALPISRSSLFVPSSPKSVRAPAPETFSPARSESGRCASVEDVLSHLV